VNEDTVRSGSQALCVVIPARNEALLVGRCIESVLAAGVAAEDVYVVDDASTDGTANAVARFPAVNLLVNETPRGKQGGLQRVLALCGLVDRYRYLSVLDADSYVSVDYVRETLAAFAADADVVLVCGSPESERHNWLTAFRALEYTLARYVFRPGQHAVGAITVAPGCASTYRTDALSALDWNGGTLVEDMDLTLQIHRRRLGTIAFAPQAVTYTQDPRTLRQYIGQVTRWYSGTWQVMRLHGVPFGRQRIDAEFALLLAEGLVYSVLVLALPVLVWLAPGLVAAALVLDQGLWLAMTGAVALRLRRADIALSFPLFVLPRAINAFVLLATFWREIVQRRARHEWFSVERYQPRGVAAPSMESSNA
jgi:cellulose synthase/poly-beta-1,6-N-acetylglucosamine synthase-like glycosyltransferase